MRKNLFYVYDDVTLSENSKSALSLHSSYRMYDKFDDKNRGLK